MHMLLGFSPSVEVGLWGPRLISPVFMALYLFPLHFLPKHA